ncbi:autotransporter assembly complex family protein [Parvibaculum sp.]|uniref:autotransporter assembly complex protein TamA n=1 Tax=Parvibaculum sp. TaxID=2024848 RepID=UPI003210FCC4
MHQPALHVPGRRRLGAAIAALRHELAPAAGIALLSYLAAASVFSPLRAAPQEPQATAPAKSTSAIAFATRVTGANIPDNLLSLLTDNMQLGKGRAPSPTTLGQLRRRAAEDASRLNEVLRSEAYYNGRVDVEISEAQGGRFDVAFKVTPGPRTMIRSFTIHYADNPSDIASLPRDAARLGLKGNRPAQAQRVIDLTAAAMSFLENHGHPRPKLAERKVVVDLGSNQADITLTIAAGPPERFGDLTIANEGRTKDDYVRSLAKFKPGDPYDRSKADETVSALRKTGLFDRVTLDVIDTPDDAVPQKLTLTERPHRSVGVGARWSSDQGAGVTTFWEHRNFFGAAERLHLDLTVAQELQLLGAHFNKPHFLRDDQSLLADFEVAHEITDAYHENRVKTAAGIARKLRENLDVSGGLSFEIERTTDSTGYHAYELFGIPLTGRYDGTDDLLDPTQGMRLGLALTPYGGRADGAATTFVKLDATASTYWSLSRKFTLALRGRYGSMLAQQTGDVPGSIRFYAGGGSSIRGYGYQLVGPLDAKKEPLGARSVFEASTEARYRLSRDIGLVAFLDAGNAWSTATPKFSEQLRLGTGIGLRYYTIAGPIRADIGVPLNRRPGIDDSFQLYFSLGQAF